MFRLNRILVELSKIDVLTHTLPVESRLVARRSARR